MRKISNGPWCLLVDNCGGHEDLSELENVEYLLLPASTTPMYQPLDLCLISMRKIRYRSLLLRSSIDVFFACKRLIMVSKLRQEEDNGDYCSIATGGL